MSDDLVDIYPIPAKYNVVISSKLKDISLKIYDVSGKQIKYESFEFIFNYLMINGFETEVCSAIQTDFVCKNSLIDSWPLSLPLPDRL